MTLVINVPALIIWTVFIVLILLTAFNGLMVEFAMLSVVFVLVSTAKPTPFYLRENKDVESP